MANKITKSFTKIWIGLILAVATAISVSAQDPVHITGVIRIPKEFGMVPAGPGSKSADPSPCGVFYVAALDPDNMDRVIAVDEANKGRNGKYGWVPEDDGEFHICRYSLMVPENRVPANRRLYVIAGVGNTNLPKQTRNPLYITDAWIGGTNNKPRRGYERGFAGKFVTLGKKDMYLKFDMYYAQVDPN